MNASTRRSYGIYQPRSRGAAVGDAVANFREAIVRRCRRNPAAFHRHDAARLHSSLHFWRWRVSMPSDPSLNEATGRAANNWLGIPGAYGADFLLRDFWRGRAGAGLAVGRLGLAARHWRAVAKLGWRAAATCARHVLSCRRLGRVTGSGTIAGGRRRHAWPNHCSVHRQSVGGIRLALAEFYHSRHLRSSLVWRWPGSQLAFVSSPLCAQ